MRRQPRLLLLLLPQSRFSKEIIACGTCAACAACGGRTCRVWRRWDRGYIAVGIYFIDNRQFEPRMREDLTDGKPFRWVMLQHPTNQIACLCRQISILNVAGGRDVPSLNQSGSSYSPFWINSFMTRSSSSSKGRPPHKRV